MKYLGIHKLLVAIILLIQIIIEMLICGLFYILYVIWNFKIPQNFWLKLHYYRSQWDEELIADRNPKQTFVRRFKMVFGE